MTEPAKHVWTFFRFAGFDQVSITTAADIAHLPELDLKLWAALSCPVQGLECDERTLALIDKDGDGKVRAPEMIEAITFVTENLVDVGTIKNGFETLPLASIDTTKPSGAAIRTCAERLLSVAGTATSVGLPDINLARDGFNKLPFNGDGIVPPASAGADQALTQAIADIISTHGSQLDRSGVEGLATTILEAFFSDAAAFSAWWQESETDPAILPLGANTLVGMTALSAVSGKIDDWFTRVRMSGFDSRGEVAFNRTLEDLQLISKDTLSAASAAVRDFPLAHVQAGAALPLVAGVNPGWAAQLEAFRTLVCVPLLGERPQLSEADWRLIQEKLAPTQAWLSRKTGAMVEKLGITRVQALLAPTVRTQLTELIARDAAFSAEYDALVPVEKLVRLHRDLYMLMHNFINFSDFYSRDRLADFQAGTLYLDGRSCELTIKVINAERHASLATMARMYLAYCDCTRASGEKMTIVAAFTAGDSDNLLVGRNGIFYDRKHQDWDATIVRVIENPISIRQAFFAPYKRVMRFIEELVAKRAASSDADQEAALNSGIAQGVAPGTPPAAPGPPKKLDLTLITGLSVVMTGIAATITAFVAAIFNLGVWMPLGLAAIMLGISMPSIIIAALKLRQRNLGPLLDANGWAVNGHVKVTIPFGSTLTQLPHLPKNSTRSIHDPYAEKKTRWGLYITLVLLVAVLGLFAYWRVAYKQWLWTPVIAWVSEAFSYNASKQEIATIAGLIGKSPSYAAFAKDAANPQFVITKHDSAARSYIVEVGDLVSDKLKPAFNLRIFDSGEIDAQDKTKLGDAQWSSEYKPAP